MESANQKTEPLAGNPQKLPWYFQTRWLIILFLSVMPFMLPLIWFHPRYSLLKKVIISILVLAATWYVFQTTISSLKALQQSYEQILNQY
jgi:hypothetical protein